MPEIDFKRISETALGHAESVVSYLLPDGKREGVEWVALNPTRPDQTKGSFKVNLNTGIWSDFATGDKGGDLIDLWAYVNRCSNGDAAVELRDFLNLPDNTRKTPSRKPQEDKTWLPIIPIPGNAPEPPNAHLRLCRKCGKGGGEMTFQHQPIFNLLTVKHRDLFTTMEKYLWRRPFSRKRFRGCANALILSI